MRYVLLDNCSIGRTHCFAEGTVEIMSFADRGQRWFEDYLVTHSVGRFSQGCPLRTKTASKRSSTAYVLRTSYVCVFRWPERDWFWMYLSHPFFASNILSLQSSTLSTCRESTAVVAVALLRAIGCDIGACLSSGVYLGVFRAHFPLPLPSRSPPPSFPDLT